MSCELGPVILSYGADAARNTERLAGELNRDGVDVACIVIVHNRSGAAPALQNPPAGAHVINVGANLGYAGGMNLGIRHQLEAGRDPILLLTQDVSLQPGATRRLVDASNRAPKYGVLGPWLLWQGRETVVNYGGLWSATGRGALIVGAPPDPDHDGITVSDYVDGSALLVRREVLHRIGLLDEKFFMYFEEAELCLRAKRAGWWVGVVLDAQASQVSGEQKRPGAFNFLMARNGLEFARLVGGRRAVAAALGRDIRQSYLLTRMLVSHKSDRARRAVASASLAARWKGVWAYFRGRWGPPPPRLAGMGDMEA